MKQQIRILILEDVGADAELIHRALRKGGLSFHSRWVETEADFQHELLHDPPDLILSDHGFPVFDGFAALALAKQRCPETPFIFVTGALGEEVAIASLKQGATDYVLKTRLAHLTPAVERALREVDERTSRRRAELERDSLLRELKETVAQFRTLSGLLPICALCKKIHDQQSGWQPLEAYLQQHSEATLTHELCPDCVQKIPPAILSARAGL